jgi:hypothetical protein
MLVSPLSARAQSFTLEEIALPPTSAPGFGQRVAQLGRMVAVSTNTTVEMYELVGEGSSVTAMHRRSLSYPACVGARGGAVAITSRWVIASSSASDEAGCVHFFPHTAFDFSGSPITYTNIMPSVGGFGTAFSANEETVAVITLFGGNIRTYATNDASASFIRDSSALASYARGVAISGARVAYVGEYDGAPGPNDITGVYRATDFARERRFMGSDFGGDTRCTVAVDLLGDELAVGCRNAGPGTGIGSVHTFHFNAMMSSWDHVNRLSTGAPGFGEALVRSHEILFVTEHPHLEDPGRVLAFDGATQRFVGTTASGIYATRADNTVTGHSIGVSGTGRASVYHLGFNDGAACARSSDCLSGYCSTTCTAAPIGTACDWTVRCASGSACSGGSCAATCAGCDAALSDASVPRDAGLDAFALDAFAFDAVTAEPDALVPDAFVPPNTDAPFPDAGMSDALSAAHDTGSATRPRDALSCTCRTSQRPLPRFAALLAVIVSALLLRRRRQVVALGAFLLLVSMTGTAHAQATSPSPAAEAAPVRPSPTADQIREARALFALAHTHYDLGRFAEAAQELERANEIAPRDEIHYDLHLAYREMGDARRSADALRRYLGSQLVQVDPEQRVILERRLAALDQTLATQAPAETVSVTAPTEIAPTTTTEPPTTTREPSVELPTATTTLAEPSAPLTLDAGLDLVPGGIVLGVGAATLVAAAVFGGLAQQTLSDRNAACLLGPTGMECPATLDQSDYNARFFMQRDAGWALLGVGLGTAAVGAILLAVGVTDDREVPSVRAACGPEGCSAAIAGAF